MYVTCARAVAVLICLLGCLSAISIGVGERADLVRDLQQRLARAEKLATSEQREELEPLYRGIIEDSAQLGDRNLLLARALDGLADAAVQLAAVGIQEALVGHLAGHDVAEEIQ